MNTPRKIPFVILHTDDPQPARALLSRHHGDVPIHCCDNYEALPDLVEQTGADVVYSVRFAGTPGFPRAALVESDAVRWVSVGGSGVDHLIPWDVERLTVTNAAGVAADMMAQYALGAMLHFSLDLPRFLAARQQRQWLDGKVAPLTGKTVLILGLGKTGTAFARLAKTMDMTTIGVRARPQASAHIDEVHGMKSLPHLWARADFLLVCVPLLDVTRGMVGEEAFAAMKPEMVLVDVSRGGVVEETALTGALENGRIRAAALDVFSTEPLPPENPLWRFDNVIITPHCSSVYDGWQMKSVEMFCANLARWRSGEKLHNIVNPQRGY